MIRMLTLIGCAFAGSPAIAAEPVPGPVPAEALRVVDGDTIEVRAHVWPGHFVETRVRLAGVDTPERRGPECEAERRLAEAATLFTTQWLDGASIALEAVELGSFAGRVIARVRREDGASLSEDLIGAGLGAPYGAPTPWCAHTAEPAPSR